MVIFYTDVFTKNIKTRFMNYLTRYTVGLLGNQKYSTFCALFYEAVEQKKMSCFYPIEGNKRKIYKIKIGFVLLFEW